jgi:hypothetical protein
VSLEFVALLLRRSNTPPRSSVERKLKVCRSIVADVSVSEKPMMAISKTLRSTLITLAACATLVAAGSARAADEDFDVKTAPGKVTVTAKGKWHINKDYPWSVIVGEKKVESKFQLEEKSAAVEAPKGHVTLKGGICNGDQCRMFKVAVDVP